MCAWLFTGDCVCLGGLWGVGWRNIRGKGWKLRWTSTLMGSQLLCKLAASWPRFNAALIVLSLRRRNEWREKKKGEFGESRWWFVKWEKEHVRTTSPFTLPLFYLLCHGTADVKRLSFRFSFICDPADLHSLGNDVKPQRQKLGRVLLHHPSYTRKTYNSCSFMLRETPGKWAHLLHLFLAATHTAVANNKLKKMVQTNVVYLPGTGSIRLPANQQEYSVAICHALKYEAYTLAPWATYRWTGRKVWCTLFN